MRLGRKRRLNLDFKRPGEESELADERRRKSKLDGLKRQVAQSLTKRGGGISTAVKVALMQTGGVAGVLDASAQVDPDSNVPQIEWWDEVVLNYAREGYGAIPPQDMEAERRYEKTITQLVEHPKHVEPPDEPKRPPEEKTYLTKKEQRKLRRDNRRFEMREHAEKIRLGLEKPPEPKVKLSNLMRVLATEHVQDPTRVEANVRKQVEERRRRHEEENAARQVSREEWADRANKKLAAEEAATASIHVAVYRVRSLRNPQKRFKVVTNAKQQQMTGIVLLLAEGQINVVVVEGGAKQQRFYRNLMLNRIRWDDEVAGQKRSAAAEELEGLGAGERNECQLLWEGLVKKRAFGEPHCVIAADAREARQAMEKHGAAHYWDICYSSTVLMPAEEDEG